jgi:hypothetical protein
MKTATIHTHVDGGGTFVDRGASVLFRSRAAALRAAQSVTANPRVMAFYLPGPPVDGEDGVRFAARGDDSLTSDGRRVVNLYGRGGCEVFEVCK